MGRRLSYKGISKDGRFILLEPLKPQFTEDLDKRSKLWTSSDYLFNESVLKTPEETKKIISVLLEWNTSQENYEISKKLSNFLKKCETFTSGTDI